MHISPMKKILLLFVALSMVTGIYSQEIDMSKVSLDPLDDTRPYLGKEVVDTLGTCMAVKAELEAIAAQGFSALYSYGQTQFISDHKNEIDAEVDKLFGKYIPEIKEQAVVESENEYQSILQEAMSLSQENFSMYYTLRERLSYNAYYEPTAALRRLIPDVCEKLRAKWCKNMLRRKGDPKIEKLSKALQKELPKYKEQIIAPLIPVMEGKLMVSKKDELRLEAETNVLRNYISKVIELMPSIDSPECYGYILSWESTQKYFRDKYVFMNSKKKLITWRNPHYIESNEDHSWDWLSLADNENREWVESFSHGYDKYMIDHRHPEYIIRPLKAKTSNGVTEEIAGAFIGDTIKAFEKGYFDPKLQIIDKEIEKVLCFYELEHNKYNINDNPEYVKDAIRYLLVKDMGFFDGYHHDLSYSYEKSHKPETFDLAYRYIERLHEDHNKKFGISNNLKLHGCVRRIERVDATTYRYYVGWDNPIVILQKLYYGNYCAHLFPYSKVTTFNNKDYVIRKNRINNEKIVSYVYIVEKYE